MGTPACRKPGVRVPSGRSTVPPRARSQRASLRVRPRLRARHRRIGRGAGRRGRTESIGAGGSALAGSRGHPRPGTGQARPPAQDHEPDLSRRAGDAPEPRLHDLLGRLGLDAGYVDTINTYFRNVAHDSGGTENVYASDTQYGDTTGAIAYDVTFGDTVLDPGAYPANGCTDKATKICLSDAQLQAEVKAVMADAPVGIPRARTGSRTCSSCSRRRASAVAPGASCAYTTYCAYHSWIEQLGGGGPLRQPAVRCPEPPDLHVRLGQRPNGDKADATINLISHEHNEAITDASRATPGSTRRVSRMGTSAPGISGQRSVSSGASSTTR